MKWTNIAAILIMLTLIAATCEKASDKECVEIVKTDCMCTLQFDPVCGCNKKTYGNACEAECHGIKTYTKGECPK